MQRKRRPTVFVTGASQGIGAGIAVTMAQRGYDVAMSSTRPAKLAPVVEQVKAAGARAFAVELEVCSQPSVEAAMAAVVKEFGEVDVLVNNAGVTMARPALDMTREEWNRIIDTDLTGTFFMSQQMGRHLIATKRPGCVISIASTHGIVAFQGRGAYGIAKAGVSHMCKVLAVEWAPHNIRVNAVAPGWVVTPSRAAIKVTPEYEKVRLDRIPLHRPGQIDEVAAAVCYLASPEASYITGHTIVLDGGVTVQ
jgi:NAD(P)-dependent dehydrogenase (short-subunit alcohol dehydrogenase family)